MPAEPSDAYALSVELQLVLRAVVRRLRDQAMAGDLTETQKSTLLRLDRDGPCTTSDLARAEGMRPQSMGAIIAVLTEGGFVQGTPDPSDGRRMILSLTVRTQDWLKSMREARRDWLCRALSARLTEDERRMLQAAVPLLHKLAEF